MKICVLGSGYVGGALAQALASTYPVCASYRSNDTQEKLSSLGLSSERIILYENHIEGNLGFFNTDLLIITIPFSKTLKNPFIYTQQLKTVLATLKENQFTPWIIFTSSTSIYSTSKLPLTEETIITPDTPRQKALYDTEQAIQHSGLPYTILRLGGIYGPDRDPTRFFSHGKPIADGPVNVVSLEEIVNAVVSLINYPSQNQIYNLVSPNHPLKSEWYTALANAQNVEAPSFYHTSDEQKWVSSEKLKLHLQIIENPL